MNLEPWDQRSVPEPALAARISIRCCFRLETLAQYAVEGHGFGNSDCGFGISYPTNLDAPDRDVDEVIIPDGHVLAYGFWGDRRRGGYEVLVPKKLYLSVLADELTRAGMEPAAAAVRAIGGDGPVE